MCDVNHPAQTIARNTTYGRLIDVSGCGLERTAEAILKLYPLDNSSTPPGNGCRLWATEKQMPIFSAMQTVVDRAEARLIKMDALNVSHFTRRLKLICNCQNLGPGTLWVLHFQQRHYLVSLAQRHKADSRTYIRQTTPSNAFRRADA
ncbi:hypothetical protein ACOJBO_10980 [Rhizobium beringeri]